MAHSLTQTEVQRTVDAEVDAGKPDPRSPAQSQEISDPAGRGSVWERASLDQYVRLRGRKRASTSTWDRGAGIGACQSACP